MKKRKKRFNPTSEDIAAATQEFLERGGEIEVIEETFMGDDPKYDWYSPIEEYDFHARRRMKPQFPIGYFG